MIGSASSRAESRPPVATLPASASLRGRKTQRRSPSSVRAISPKVRNFKLTEVRSFKLTLTTAYESHSDSLEQGHRHATRTGHH